jgi:spore maturation protein CgeB
MIKKIMVTGEGAYSWMAPAWVKVLRDFNYHVLFVDQNNYIANNLFSKALNRVNFRLFIRNYNKAIVESFNKYQPDLVFLHNPYNIESRTLEKLKGRAILSGYCHDNYFAEIYEKYKIGYKEIVSLFDTLHVLRDPEFEFLRIKYQNVRLFKAECYFCPWDHKLEIRAITRQISFVGHAENDERIEYIAKAIESNIPISISGPTKQWHKMLPSKYIKKIDPIVPLHGKNYVTAIQSSNVSLAFYGKANFDNHGIRTYEIPACGSLLLSQDTSKVRELYKVGSECDVFDSFNDFIEKIDFYTRNLKIRNEVALAGNRRGILSGYDIYSRAKDFIRDIEDYKNA